MLWLTLAVACWFGGMRVERWRQERDREEVDTYVDDNPFAEPPVVGRTPIQQTRQTTLWPFRRT
jgi:hypothetical protein